MIVTDESIVQISQDLWKIKQTSQQQSLQAKNKTHTADELTEPKLLIKPCL